jgi:hypothetical protein
MDPVFIRVELHPPHLLLYHGLRVLAMPSDSSTPFLVLGSSNSRQRLEKLSLTVEQTVLLDVCPDCPEVVT